MIDDDDCGEASGTVIIRKRPSTPTSYDENPVTRV